MKPGNLVLAETCPAQWVNLHSIIDNIVSHSQTLPSCESLAKDLMQGVWLQG